MSNRNEADLSVSIRKATSIDETAPKRKHVRSCIVYTWDHKSSAAFWAALKVHPIIADEVQTFKALITIHKVLQEGHPVVIREAQGHIGFLDSLLRGASLNGKRGYGTLIEEYVVYLETKLDFHRRHPEFNGLFEYEEYISLKTINDPNEGYETITELMSLQDQIDAFQKLVFSHFSTGSNNECRISALVPFVTESYGIYKFITSMLRAMHRGLDNEEALSPLRSSYNNQHLKLVRFYYECSNLRYLTSLITIPKLPQQPPSLLSDDEKPSLPARPIEQARSTNTSAKPAHEPEPIGDFWSEDAARQQEVYEVEQSRLEHQLKKLQQEQALAHAQSQRDLELQQRMVAEQQEKASTELLRDQLSQQSHGVLAELEQENLKARAEYERDQLLLQQYDKRVKELEEQLSEMQSNYSMQNSLRTDQIKSLHEQLRMWRSKYEALAKLYAQLRQEHLGLLQTTKSLKLKAMSAEEAISKREKSEQDLKAKSMELAAIIRERDRALHEVDRLRTQHTQELERLRRDVKLASQRAENLQQQKDAEISSLLLRGSRETSDMESLLKDKERLLDEARREARDKEEVLLLKEKELSSYKSEMEQALDEAVEELESFKLAQADSDKALDKQIDNSGIQRVDDALYELESTMQAGNQNASPEYVQSQIEKASTSSADFAGSFISFLSGRAGGAHADIIRTVSVFAGSIADVLSNTKGITRLCGNEKTLDSLINHARRSAEASIHFFKSLQSFRMTDLGSDEKTGVVRISDSTVQQNLQTLSSLVDALVPKYAKIDATENLCELVDREMSNTANAIEAAAGRLVRLKGKPRESYSGYELRIHDCILEASLGITNSIGELIKAATDAQNQIVREGKGTQSRTAFYKRNNRWTEGFISAAKAIATSTNVLIETADGVVSVRNSMEQLIVASNDVAASTAQLVAASRVKASYMSNKQSLLEDASRTVSMACRGLVRQVKNYLEEETKSEGAALDYASLSAHDLKVREMEQQVEILQLENSLAKARMSLGELRKISYRDD